MATISEPAPELTLLVDGDVVAFICAAACQHVEVDIHGFIRPFAQVVEGEAAVDNTLHFLMDRLGATHMRVFLTDPESNWRHGVDPNYKAVRKDLVRPLLLARLKDYLRVRYGAEHWAGLEADDVLGILATHPTAVPGDKIVVGRDKDFKTIPGKHHTLRDLDENGEPIVRTVTLAEADAFHMTQALAGDRVDGYAGCPGIGMERAARIVANPEVLTPEEGVVTRGPRKGERTTKWVATPTDDVWAAIVSQYRKAGLGEKDALRTARLARILRASDYDLQTARITLWTPPSR